MTKSELEKEIKALKEKAVELEKKLKNTNEFEVGDIYYCITGVGDILEDTWNDSIYDLGKRQIGNCFKTKEEAEFVVERLKVIKELKDYAKEHNDEIDWDNRNNIKYVIRYDYEARHINWYLNTVLKANDIYFSSKEIAEDAVKEIGEFRIKKYYLKVEEGGDRV